MADLGETGEIFQLQKEKKSKERFEFSNYEDEGEIGKGDFKGLIIDRSKTQGEIDSQIDVSAQEFRKLESSEEHQEDNQFMRAMGCSDGWRKDGPPPYRNVGRG